MNPVTFYNRQQNNFLKYLDIEEEKKRRGEGDTLLIWL